MIVNYTDAERQELDEIERHYALLIEQCEYEIEQARPNDPGPDRERMEAIYISMRELHKTMLNFKEALAIAEKAPLLTEAQQNEITKLSDDICNLDTSLDKEYKEAQAIYEEWEAAGSDEWKAARRKHFELMDELSAKRRQFQRKCERRQFSSLKGDPEKIKEDAKKQIEQLIKNRYEDARMRQASGETFFIPYIRASGNDLYIDQQNTIDASKELLELHYDFFRDDPEGIKAINALILEAIANSPYTSNKGIKTTIYGDDPIKNNPIGPNVTTNAPTAWITPIDKITDRTFEGKIIPGGIWAVSVGSRKSKKKIITKVSIDFPELPVSFTGKRPLNDYDREVHDALVSLFVDGENDYITPQMIRRAMIGDEEARLTDEQQKTISDSLNKLMYSRVTIDATEEDLKISGFDKFKYEGPIINGEKITATLNGTVCEVIHLLKEPVLYSYANAKNQIGRFDIKLLNVPRLNKTEEVIIIQSFLSRRILAMKGPKSKMSHNIPYDSIFDRLDIQAPTAGAIRKKKSLVRKTVKNILDYWKKAGFINDYTENKKGNSYLSVTIDC